MRTSRIAAFAAATALLLTAGAASAQNVTTVRWGPIVLPAATPEGPGEAHNEIAGAGGFASAILGLFTSIADYQVNKPCSNCYILGIEPNLVFPDGTTANHMNGTMLHHVVNINWDRPDITCRPGFSNLINLVGLAAGGNERFYASGNERTINSMPSGYGYYVGSGDDWGLIYHLMNMSPNEKTVYFEYKFTWVPASGSGITRTRPIWLDIDQCDDSETNTPAGYSDTEWTWKADRSNYVVDIGGHVHDYGISIAFRNHSRNQNICTSVAGYAPDSTWAPVGPGSGADDSHPVSYNTVTTDPLGLHMFHGRISDMTQCDPFSRVSKGNTTRVHAQYNRPNATDHDMGIMVGFLDEDYCITNFWCF